MKKAFLTISAMMLASCAAPVDISTASCAALNRELDIAIADMEKPAIDRYYARKQSPLRNLGPVGAIATVAAETLNANTRPDIRVEFPEAYAKKIGLELTRRCS